MKITKRSALIISAFLAIFIVMYFGAFKYDSFFEKYRQKWYDDLNAGKTVSVDLAEVMKKDEKTVELFEKITRIRFFASTDANLSMGDKVNCRIKIVNGEVRIIELLNNKLYLLKIWLSPVVLMLILVMFFKIYKWDRENFYFKRRD